MEFHGHECKIIDYCYEEFNLQKLVELIENENIKIITFSVYTINVEHALEIAKYLKKTLKDIIIIFGGPHATLDSEYCYTSRYVDYVHKSEGESSLLELIE